VIRGRSGRRQPDAELQAVVINRYDRTEVGVLQRRYDARRDAMSANDRLGSFG
jgi:hypothetical protein